MFFFPSFSLSLSFFFFNVAHSQSHFSSRSIGLSHYLVVRSFLDKSPFSSSPYSHGLLHILHSQFHSSFSFSFSLLVSFNWFVSLSRSLLKFRQVFLNLYISCLRLTILSVTVLKHRYFNLIFYILLLTIVMLFVICLYAL